jgi:hypothetical protein
VYLSYFLFHERPPLAFCITHTLSKTAAANYPRVLALQRVPGKAMAVQTTQELIGGSTSHEKSDAEWFLGIIFEDGDGRWLYLKMETGGNTALEGVAVVT